MINLKLAEYDLETKKFIKFIKLGSDYGEFMYVGDCVFVIDDFGYSPDMCHDLGARDPLNRFNGRFDGRTYGHGKFVLILDDQDNVYLEKKVATGKDHDGIRFTIDYDCYSFKADEESYYHKKPEQEYQGELHENPEFWDKIGTVIKRKHTEYHTIKTIKEND